MTFDIRDSNFYLLWYRWFNYRLAVMFYFEQVEMTASFFGEKYELSFTPFGYSQYSL